MGAKKVELELNKKAYLVKVLITYLFLGLAGWAIVLLLDEQEEPWGCSVDSEKLCTFKKVAACISCLLLLPFWVEANYQAFIIGGYVFGEQTQKREFLVDEAQGFIFSWKKEKRAPWVVSVFAILGPFVWLPFIFYSADKYGWKNRKLAASVYFMLLIWPESILSSTFFLLSVLVILSSQTVGEVLINLVAMQIFAQLDDILVKMIVRPDLSNGQVFLSYVKAPKLEKEEDNKVTPTVEP